MFKTNIYLDVDEGKLYFLAPISRNLSKLPKITNNTTYICGPKDKDNDKVPTLIIKTFLPLLQVPISDTPAFFKPKVENISCIVQVKLQSGQYYQRHFIELKRWSMAKPESM